MSTFEIVRGVEGDCLVLDNTRICGPKPWGGGRIIKTFCTDGIYEVIYKDEYRKLLADNAKLRELVSDFWTDMNTCHLNGDVPNERDLDFYRPRVHEFGITDISERELGVEVDE